MAYVKRLNCAVTLAVDCCQDFVRVNHHLLLVISEHSIGRSRLERWGCLTALHLKSCFFTFVFVAVLRCQKMNLVAAGLRNLRHHLRSRYSAVGLQA